MLSGGLLQAEAVDGLGKRTTPSREHPCCLVQKGEVPVGKRGGCISGRSLGVSEGAEGVVLLEGVAEATQGEMCRSAMIQNTTARVDRPSSVHMVSSLFSNQVRKHL